MMNLGKVDEYFNPSYLKGKPIHILGCGATGSALAECLSRFGITNMKLYDFDKVDSHNISNQMFTNDDIGKEKVLAVKEYLCKINPDCEEVEVFRDGYTDQPLDGYVFLCVDNIDLRRKIAKDNKYNMQIDLMFDFRIGLCDAQHYAAEWKNGKMVDIFLESMNFTQEEGLAQAPMSACNMMLSFVPSVRTIVCHGVSNFVNYLRGEGLCHTILINMETHVVDAFKLD